MLKKTTKSPLDGKEIKTVNAKGNQPCIFIGKTDAEAESPILWPSDAKSWLTGKNSDGGKDWMQKEKRPQRMRWLDSITDSTGMNLSKLQETVKDRGAWCAAVHVAAKSQTWLSDWTIKILLKELGQASPVFKNLPLSNIWWGKCYPEKVNTSGNGLSLWNSRSAS